MDPLDRYRDAVTAVLQPWEQRPGPESKLRFEFVGDRARDRYLVVVVGWEGAHHVHSTLVHVDLVEGKLWIQHDQTEQGVAPELVAAGVAPEHIVLGFKSPARRAVTGYAVA